MESHETRQDEAGREASRQGAPEDGGGTAEPGSAQAAGQGSAQAAGQDSAAPAAGGGGETAERIRTALRAVKDPELGFNIVDLGLVYDIELEGGEAMVTMTLTSPGCPAGGQILGGAKEAAESVDGVESARVNLVWKPFWTPDRIDPKVRAAMGF